VGLFGIGIAFIGVVGMIKISTSFKALSYAALKTGTDKEIIEFRWTIMKQD
jgi:hypothetical protein